MLNLLNALLALFRTKPDAKADRAGQESGAKPPETTPAPSSPEAESGQRPDKDRTGQRAALAALLGSAAAAILVPLVERWEGTELVPYKDVVGIWTVCTGDTHDVDPARTYTKEECEERLERQLIAHAKPVLKCVPQIADKPNVLAASISLAYNVGPAAFCRSSLATKFRQGDIRGGCDGFLAWRYAGGREIRGLKNRRLAEREICRRDL